MVSTEKRIKPNISYAYKSDCGDNIIITYGSGFSIEKAVGDAVNKLLDELAFNELKVVDLEI